MSQVTPGPVIVLRAGYDLGFAFTLTLPFIQQRATVLVILARCVLLACRALWFLERRPCSWRLIAHNLIGQSGLGERRAAKYQQGKQD